MGRAAWRSTIPLIVFQPRFSFAKFGLAAIVALWLTIWIKLSLSLSFHLSRRREDLLLPPASGTGISLKIEK